MHRGTAVVRIFLGPFNSKAEKGRGLVLTILGVVKYMRMTYCGYCHVLLKLPVLAVYMQSVLVILQELRV